MINKIELLAQAISKITTVQVIHGQTYTKKPSIDVFANLYIEKMNKQMVDYLDKPLDDKIEVTTNTKAMIVLDVEGKTMAKVYEAISKILSAINVRSSDFKTDLGISVSLDQSVEVDNTSQFEDQQTVHRLTSRFMVSVIENIILECPYIDTVQLELDSQYGLETTMEV